MGHTLNLSAIKSPYYISASFKYACSKLVCMNMPGFKNALNRYIFTIIFHTVISLRKVDSSTQKHDVQDGFLLTPKISKSLT